MRAQGRAMGSCPFPEDRVNVWGVKIEVESMIGDVPWGVGYRSEKCGLISLDDSYFELSSTSPQFYYLCPHWFQHCFIKDKLVF